MPSREREYLELFSRLCMDITNTLGKELAQYKDSSRNLLGEDVDLETLEKMTAVAQGQPAAAALSTYERAQLGELSFWRWVAFEGYCGLDPRAFRCLQHTFMLGCFIKTGWSLRELEAEDLVEVGCGPLGMIEFLPAKSRVAFDPLNAHYERLFGKARAGGVEYVVDLERLVRERRGRFDLGICFNVLDHAENARELFVDYLSLIRPGGRFLLQVNTVRDGFERSLAHTKMHPSPFKVEELRALLDGAGCHYEDLLDTDPSPDNEFFFMAWGTKR